MRLRIESWETGSSVIYLDELMVPCRALNLTPHDLMDGGEADVTAFSFPSWGLINKADAHWMHRKRVGVGPDGRPSAGWGYLHGTATRPVREGHRAARTASRET